jgi:hypothetical protein
LKPVLVELLKALDAPRLQEEASEIAHCSFGMPWLNRKWHKVFFQHVQEHLTQLYAQLDTPEWVVCGAWYQSYEIGNTHHRHNHGECTWANVYYLELPDPKFGTRFHHPARAAVEQRGCLSSDSPPILQPEVREGDIVTFPGYLEHESPVIEGNCAKTVISFNVFHRRNS